MQFREYLRCRRLAFSLRQLRDTEESVLQIALDHGFSFHEAFTRAFREAYGLTPASIESIRCRWRCARSFDLLIAIFWRMEKPTCPTNKAR